MTSPLQSVSGLASGLDTATIVSQLMAIERQPLVRLQSAQSVEQARQTALQTVQTKLDALSSAVSDLRSATAWGDTQTVESSDATIVAASRIGGAAAGGYAVVVSQLASADQLVQDGAFTTATEATKLTVTVGGAGGGSVTVDVAAGNDAAAIASKINGSSNTPVYASVVNGKLTLSGKTTGAAATISVSAPPSTGGYDLVADLYASPHVGTNHDAVVSIGGVAQSGVSSNVIDNLIPGVKLTLKAAGTITVSVGAPGPDTDAIKGKVGAFVTAYNDALGFISSKLNEQRPANPKTDADRAKGVLAGDPGLSALLSDLRSAISTPLAGAPAAMKLVSQAGLSTGKTTGSGALSQDAIAGRLTLDSDALATALGSSFTHVKALIAGTGGLSDRLKSLIDPWVVGNGTHAALLDSRIQSSTDAISRYGKQQTDMQVRLDAYQQRLNLQFTAMETALQGAQSQAQWLSGQLAAL